MNSLEKVEIFNAATECLDPLSLCIEFEEKLEYEVISSQWSTIRVLTYVLVYMW